MGGWITLTALDTFLVTCDGIDSVGIDYVDPNVEPDESTVFAFVKFRARLSSDTVIWLATATPPRGIQLDEVKARFAPEDGVLRTIVGEPTNERQRVTVTGNPWSVSFSGQPTSNLAQTTATAAQFDAALEALSNIGVNEVYVSGVDGGPFDVTFHGTLGYSNVPVMVGTNASVTTLDEGTLDAGVKLVANTALLDLDDPLIYDVTFEIPESDRKIAPFAFTAPTTNGATIDLATVTKLPPKDPGTFE